MKITDRQGEILNIITREYINSAEPVSSQLLEKKYNLDICPATIRIEMQKLTDKGFLQQPHTSAGRVPTDKGYRFFVDSLRIEDSFNGMFKEIEAEMEDSFRFFQSITKRLAERSSALVLGYLPEEEILFKEGWTEALHEPEFKDAEFISRFLETIDSFEKNINKFFEELPEDFHVYIGRENPIPKGKDFTLMTSKAKFSKKEKGMIALLGPKRMEYDRNIGLVNSLLKLLE